MRRIPKSEVLHKELNQILEGIFDDLDEGAYFGHIRTPIPVTSGQCFGIIRTAFRSIRTPCRVIKITGTL